MVIDSSMLAKSTEELFSQFSKLSSVIVFYYCTNNRIDTLYIPIYEPNYRGCYMTLKISEVPELWEMVRDKEGYICGKKISDLTLGSTKYKIYWKCNNGYWPDSQKPADDHEWSQEVSARWDSEKEKVRQCPFCRGNRVCESNSLWAHAKFDPEGHKFIEQWCDNNNTWRYSTSGESKFLTLWKCVGHKTSKQVRPKQHDRKNTKLLWKCEDGDDHIWFSNVANRGRGRQCPFCYGDSISLSNCLLTTHSELSKQWHSTDNRNFNPCCFKASSKRYRPTWQCHDGYEPDRITIAKDHIWSTQIANRTRDNGSNCPYCSGAEVCLSTSLTSTHPKLWEIWSEQNTQSLDEISHGFNEKYYWKCTNGHIDYPQSPKSKIQQEAGCPSCAKTGFQPDKPAHYYVHKIINVDTSDILYYKGGISNNWRKRMKQISYTIPKHMEIINIETIEFPLGIDAQNLERKLLDVNELRAPSRSFDGGHELFISNPLDHARRIGDV
jgi:hypothetical protein